MSSGAEAYIGTDSFYVKSSSTTFSGDVRLNFNRELRMNDGNIVNPYGLYLNHGGSLYSVSSNGQLRLETANGSNLSIRANGSEALRIDGSYMYSKRNLSMEGNRITNQSDRRLKRNILPSTKDSLGKFSKVKYKWFEYVPGHGLAEGLNHGVIAQEVMEFAPEWIATDPDGYYVLDQTAMQMDSFKAITQLAEKVKKLEAIINGK